MKQLIKFILFVHC